MVNTVFISHYFDNMNTNSVVLSVFFSCSVNRFKLCFKLKGLAQAKIVKKSVILFRVLNMTIWCKHVHRLELQIFIIFGLSIYQLG